MTHLYACLVHERPDCVLDLVRNLRAHDPASAILLYNGGPDPRLLDIPELAGLDATVHPKPSAMKWGALHRFALDCMRFGLSEFGFDAMTIVDSDQLMTRAGYVDSIDAEFSSDASVGMLGNSIKREGPATSIPPCVTAHQETELWRPFLEKFDEGPSKWVHWSFWPSTVFRGEACRELVRLFDGDRHLQRALEKSRLWATEEVLFPTLTRLLGHQIGMNPCSYDYVKYRARYTTRHISRALDRNDVFWIHPVKRQINDPVRKLIRSRQPRQLASAGAGDGHAGPIPLATDSSTDLPMALSLLQRIRSIDGWLEPDEADLVMTAALKAMAGPLAGHAVVEVGSYCGRATVLLGSLATALESRSRVVAIDTFDGVVGASGGRLERRKPTLDRFKTNLASAGIEDRVDVLVDRSFNVPWDRPVSLLLVDGLHDYENVRRDFLHFEPHLREDSLILFHDYAHYFPGVVRFVDELLRDPGYEVVRLVRSMMLVRRARPATATGNSGPADAAALPRISCIMPTCDRRPFVASAIALFRDQDHPNKELIVIDDGGDAVEDLVPNEAGFRYVRLPRRATIGKKRNLAAEMAAGSLVAHWDDDDWYGSHRLTSQLRAFEDRKCGVSGLDRILFVDPEARSAWRYHYPPGGRSWVYGATLMYRKEVWETHPFREVNEGEDTRFVWNVAKGIRASDDRSWFVGRIHPKNTSRKKTHTPRWTPATIDEIVEETRGEWSIDEWNPATEARESGQSAS